MDVSSTTSSFAPPSTGGSAVPGPIWQNDGHAYIVPPDRDENSTIIVGSVGGGSGGDTNTPVDGYFPTAQEQLTEEVLKRRISELEKMHNHTGNLEEATAVPATGISYQYLWVILCIAVVMTSAVVAPVAILLSRKDDPTATIDENLESEPVSAPSILDSPSKYVPTFPSVVTSSPTRTTTTATLLPTSISRTDIETSPTDPQQTTTSSAISDLSVCACSPGTYEFTFDLSSTCSENLSSSESGVSAVSCLVSNFGESDVVDLVPVAVQTIDILELGQDLRVLVQENIAGNFANGDSFLYFNLFAPK